MLDDHEKARILASWKRLDGVPVAEVFYGNLFAREPGYRALFTSDFEEQKQKLAATLAFVVAALDWKDDDWDREVPEDEDLFVAVVKLGRRHNQVYKVPPESYDVVGAALLDTLQAGLGDAFDAPTRAAWTRLYTVLARTMRMAT